MNTKMMPGAPIVQARHRPWEVRGPALAGPLETAAFADYLTATSICLGFASASLGRSTVSTPFSRLAFTCSASR